MSLAPAVELAAPAPKPFPAGPPIKSNVIAPDVEAVVIAPVIPPSMEGELAAAMAEPPRRTSLASGSSAYPDSIAREIAARRDDAPVRAEATANLRIETAGTDVNDDSNARIAEPRRKKGVPVVFIAGGVGAVLVIAVVAVFAMRGGGGKSEGKQARVSAGESASAREHEVPETADTRAAGEAPGAGSAMRIDEARAKPVAAAAGSASEGAPAPTPEPAIEPEPPTPTPPVQPPAPVATPRKAPTLGGKKVVLEYDNAAPKEAPKKTPAKGDDSASVGAARITYFNGNRKLFAGDADGAIRLYKQALAVYPGYVAGYRGLGLAYSQKGDKANALKSFRTYLNAVPGAKDAALIKKRIAALQRQR